MEQGLTECLDIAITMRVYNVVWISIAVRIYHVRETIARRGFSAAINSGTGKEQVT